jgi:hypothetical protein
MAQQETPAQWRKDVCAVLETANSLLIEWKLIAGQRYDNDATDAKMRAGEIDVVYPSEVYPFFIKYLSSDRPTGCLKNMAVPPGETCEFFFEFFGERFYGKILLRPNRRNIVIFSAHYPEWDLLSCE